VEPLHHDQIHIAVAVEVAEVAEAAETSGPRNNVSALFTNTPGEV